MDIVEHITDATFEEKVLKPKNMLIIVDFWAPWCGPCRMLGPVLDKLAPKYAGKVQIKKLNVDENQKHTAAFGVSGIPAVKMFKNGKVVDEFVGFIPEAQIVAWIEKNIAKK